MYRLHAQQSQTRTQHTYHEVCQLREQARSAFSMDLMSLEQWSRLGLIFWKICGDIQRDTQALLRRGEFVPEELLHLSSALSDTYYCNFSVFQSSPDAWAVDQLFPCLPLHRLEEEPSRRGVLADITCDSDGQLKRFIDREQPKETLELHPWNGEPYWIGLFMVGAYQEILGDLHNLFGDTNTVHVS